MSQLVPAIYVKNVITYWASYFLGAVGRCVKKHIGPLCKVTVNFTLEQATKAKRGSSGIAPLFP